MRRPNFLEGAAVALIAALAGALTYAALAWALPAGTALRLLVAGLGLGYLIYLLGRCPTRAGRLATLALWFAAAAVLWLLSPPLPLYVAGHLGLPWLARSLHYHSGPLAALADLGLTGLGLTAAVGAYLHTGSPFLALWSLFLVQALFVFIPERGAAPTGEVDRFQRAFQTAEAAVRKLSATRRFN